MAYSNAAVISDKDFMSQENGRQGAGLRVGGRDTWNVMWRVMSVVDRHVGIVRSAHSAPFT